MGGLSTGSPRLTPQAGVNCCQAKYLKKFLRRQLIFAGLRKGFESQWLCGNHPLREGGKRLPRRSDSLKIS
jgi:hypothetical protein